jgi:REP element-mobilizing transposase RayT
MEFSEHLPWRSRGYLPHVDAVGELQMITYRLADSLPRSEIEKLKLELEGHPEKVRSRVSRLRVEELLDSGLGCCALARPDVAKVVEDTFLKFDSEKYELLHWCIMPNHVHVLIRPYISLGLIVQSWKSYTGRWALQNNERLGLGIQGECFWMREYWDRFIRNLEHFENAVSYIRANPVKARLCANPEDWRWGSAWSGR